MNYLKLITGISLLYLSSCSPSVTEEYAINNQSNSEITVYFDINTFHSIDSKKEKTVYIGTGANDGGHPFLTDSVWITSKYSKLVFYESEYNKEKSIYDIINNWDSKTISQKRSKSHYKYIYTVKEEDF